MTLSLALGELAMRAFSFVPRVADPDLGYVGEAGGTAHWAVEGNGTAHYGEQGVRGAWDPAHEPHPILVIGDSMTEALQVDDEDTFTYVARERLRSLSFERAVINVGVQGQRTPFYVSLAPKYRERFQPAWSVVALNDDDLGPDMFERSGTYFTGGTAGEPLTLHDVPPEGTSWTRRTYRRLRSRSALLQRSALQATGFLAEARATRLFGASPPPPPPLPLGASDAVVPALEQIVDAYDGRVTLLFMSAFDPTNLATPSATERIVQSFCAARGASCVFARQAWSAFAQRHGTPYGFPNGGWNRGHPNREGHHAFGLLLADELARLASHGLL